MKAKGDDSYKCTNHKRKESQAVDMLTCALLLGTWSTSSLFILVACQHRRNFEKRRFTRPMDTVGLTSHYGTTHQSTGAQRSLARLYVAYQIMPTPCALFSQTKTSNQSHHHRPSYPSTHHTMTKTQTPSATLQPAWVLTTAESGLRPPGFLCP